MKPLKVCLLFDSLEPKHLEDMQRVAPTARFVQVPRDKAREDLRDADIAFGWPKPEDLQRAENLRWIQLPSAGADAYVKDPCLKERGIVVTNSSGVFGIPISEHVVGMMLMLTRKLHECVRVQERRLWQRPDGIDELYGKTAGILGLGDIGTEVARRVKAFGMRVLAVKRRPADKPSCVDELYGADGLDHVISEADFLILCLPNTAATAGTLSRERLQAMKRGSYIVNIGRGKLIDEDALIEALANGHLAGAGLDVFTTEPLPEENPLWEMANVIISPHTSGKHPKHGDRSTAIFCRNLQRFLEGEPLENQVDVDQGY